MQVLPPTSAELVLDMLAQYPEPQVRPGMDADEIQFRAGQRSVVLHYAALMGRPIGDLTAAAKARRGAGRTVRG